VPAVTISPSQQSFVPGSTVNLINKRAGARVYSIFRDGYNRFEMDPEVWTDEFLMALSTELRRRGVREDPGGIDFEVGVDLRPSGKAESQIPRLEVVVTVAKFRRIYPLELQDGALPPISETSPSLKDQCHAAMKDLLEDREVQSLISTQ